MKQSPISFRFHRTVLALAVCAALVPAHAESAPAQTTITFGLGLVDGAIGDRALFGQYTGLGADRNVVAMLGIDYSLRKQDPATWVELQGANLLGDTRELSLVWKNPGSWKFAADYNEMVRYDPNRVNTGLIGFGSTAPQVVVLPGGPGTGADFELKTKRTSLGLGFTKIINPSLQFSIDLKSENKDGARLFGTGMNCPTAIDPDCGPTTGISTGWALLMLPEPIKANHSQIEARLSYAVDKLRVSAGYYGSFYRNANNTLNPGIPGSLNNPLGNPLPLSARLQGYLSQPLALPPDNQAYQFDLSGTYAFTDTTRGNFKLAYASASQNADFASAGLVNAPVGVANLGGEVNTRMAKIGLTSRPMPKLSLLADLRYEDKDDQTPINCYNNRNAGLIAPCTSVNPLSTTNRALSNTKTQGKLQASWQFNSDYRGTLGADFESIDRGVYTASSALSGLSALRQDTNETTLRAELRRRVSEDLSGAFSMSSSRRDGSNWLKGNSGPGVTEVADPADPATGFLTSAVFMPTLADRQRDKVKLFADWQPSDKLSVQVSAEVGQDNFSAPSNYGLQSTRMNQVSIDGSYAINSSWTVNGYASQGVQTFNQARYAGYVMAFENTSQNLGMGVTGKASSKLRVGASLSYINDRSVYAQGLDAFGGADSVALLAATGGLPDIVFRQTVLKLYGNYAHDKGSAMRVDLMHQRSHVNDWAWGYNGVPFSYSDGSTVTQSQNQNVSFIGITYIYQLP